jgi:hypothetical protein
MLLTSKKDNRCGEKKIRKDDYFEVDLIATGLLIFGFN